VFSNLVHPTAIRFASDGRVFVAEKSGLVKVFDSLSDTQPDVFADLRTQVHNFWDRGLLGLALHPDFPNRRYLYVLYTYDAAIGGTAPRWGTPGATADGCVVSGRLSRLTASGNSMVGSEQVLIEDWCQQYPSHSIGSLAFGADGALYVLRRRRCERRADARRDREQLGHLHRHVQAALSPDRRGRAARRARGTVGPWPRG
jgi:glucose/arabinose dehydrogenase